MNTVDIRAAYRRYAKIYDKVFGRAFKAGHEAVRTLAFSRGEKVLEIGVGTGLSLPMYPRDIHIVGIDLCEEMLDVARKRIAKHGLSVDLQTMNAEDMRFESKTFDKVVAMYVVSVTPNLPRLIGEMKRVCKQGGEIVIVNHFRSSFRAINAIERILQPFSRILGFTPSLDLRTVIEENGIKPLEIRDLDRLGNWKMIRVQG